MTFPNTAHVEYLVESDDAHWTITFCGQHHGRFVSRRAALRQALGDTWHARRFGHEVQVWARRQDGSVRAVWAEDHMLTRFARRAPTQSTRNAEPSADPTAFP